MFFSFKPSYAMKVEWYILNVGNCERLPSYPGDYVEKIYEDELPLHSLITGYGKWAWLYRPGRDEQEEKYKRWLRANIWRRWSLSMRYYPTRDPSEIKKGVGAICYTEVQATQPMPQLEILSDDGFKVFVNGEQVAEHWKCCPTFMRIPLELKKGETAVIKIVWFDSCGSGWLGIYSYGLKEIQPRKGKAGVGTYLALSTIVGAGALLLRRLF